MNAGRVLTTLEGNRRLPLLLAMSVAVVAVAVFANSLPNGFAYDDDYIIKSRDVVHGVYGLGQVLASPYWPEGFSAGLYRPLTLLTYALDWQIWNGHPFGFHLVNVLLHAAVSALVVLFLLRFFPWWAAAIGGLVFAVHSVHTEAVANVVGRAELLVALFSLAACLIYVRAVRRDGISMGAGLAIVGLYALAGFSKEAGVVLPGLLLATDLPLLRHARSRDWKGFIRRRAPLFAALTVVLVLIFVARWLALGSPIEHRPDRVFALDDSFATRLFTMSRVWPRYFELLLLPLDLSADYSPGVILPADQLTPLGAIGMLLVLATLGVAIALFRRAPELSVAVAWAAVALLPVSNLIIMAEIVLAERTLYLPSVAVSILAALVLTRAPAPRRRWVLVGAAAWILLFSLVTVRRNPVWDSTDSVFEDLRRKHPESSRLLFGVASMMLRQGDWEQAEEWFDRSIEVWPYHPPYLTEYAVHLVNHGELEKAEGLAAEAVRLRPENVDFRVFHALIRFKAGDLEGALEVVQNGIDELGERPRLYAFLADIYRALGKHGEAVAAERRASELREGEATWRELLRLAAFEYTAGDTAAAEVILERVEAMSGVDPEAVDSVRRGWMLPASSAGRSPGARRGVRER